MPVLVKEALDLVALFLEAFFKTTSFFSAGFVRNFGGGMLMRTDNRRANHLNIAIGSRCDCVHNPAPDTRFAPSVEPVVAGLIGTVSPGQIGPGCTRAQNSEDFIQGTSIVHPAWFGPSCWQQRFDDRPFEICTYISHGSKLLMIRSLSHIPAKRARIEQTN